MSYKLFTFIVLSLIGSLAFAVPPLDQLQDALGTRAQPDSVRPTTVPGLYEVVLDGQVFYLSEDGRFAILGSLIDLRSSTDLTEVRRSELRLDAIQKIGDENMVIFAPPGPAKHTITVFTDIDCGYCRKLHREIEAYNDSGIEVRYMMFPRAGIGSDSYDKAVSVWCSKDRKDALTRAKQGENIASRSCPNPVKDHYELGQVLGVRGTPSIILENGEMLAGYVPASRLAEMLDR